MAHWAAERDEDTIAAWCEGLTSYLRFPGEHHHRIRHLNFIEHAFGETRRRVEVIGRLSGETSCLTSP